MYISIYLYIYDIYIDIYTHTHTQVIFVGIIDTLVPFSLRKRAEYFIKSLLQYGQNFSVVPPAAYAARFTAFCTSVVSGAAQSQASDEAVGQEHHSHTRA